MILHQNEALLMKSGSMPTRYFIWIRNSNKSIVPLLTEELIAPQPLKCRVWMLGDRWQKSPLVWVGFSSLSQGKKRAPSETFL